MTNHRSTRTPLTEAETQGALDELVTAMSEDFISPRKAIAPSAVQLLMKRGIVNREGRASYILYRLVEAGAIEAVPNSHSYKVLRNKVAVGRMPILPAATQESYEATIRRLDELLTEKAEELEQAKSAYADELARMKSEHQLELMEVKNALVRSDAYARQAEADLADLRGQLKKLDEPIKPASDVQAIMNSVLSK